MDELDLCFQALRQPVGWLGGSSKRIAALQRIAQIGDPRHAAWIFDILYDRDADVVAAAAAAVMALMAKVGPEAWTGLYPSFHNVNLQQHDVARLDQFPAEQAVHLLGVASLNGNGYVRQEALGRLGAIRRAEALPYIMLRLADWVPAVRATAERLVRVAMDRGLTGRLLDYTYLLAWMERVERVDLTPAREMLRAALAACSPEDLRAGLESALPEARLLCFRALLVDLTVQDDLVERALRDPAIPVRSWLLQQVVATPNAHTARWLAVLLKDRAAALRTATLHVVANSFWDRLHEQVHAMIFDDSASVRDAARFYLRRHGATDFADRYRACLRDPSGRICPAAVAGLAEAGTLEDYDQVAAFAEHPRPKLRAAGIGGMARLAVDRALPRLANALNDSNGKVRRVASAALLRSKPVGVRALLLPVLEHGTAAGRRAALQILAQSGSWDALRDILYAVVRGDEPLAQSGWLHLQAWYSHYRTGLFVQPQLVIQREVEQLAADIGHADDLGPEQWALWKAVCSLVHLPGTSEGRPA